VTNQLRHVKMDFFKLHLHHKIVHLLVVVLK